MEPMALEKKDQTLEETIVDLAARNQSGANGEGRL